MDYKTKLICTIGPASEKPDILEQLILGGMNIARMNFSHCTYEEFKNRRSLINEFNKKYGKNVKIMQDLQGPRMRVGILPDQGILLEPEQEVLFSTNRNNKKAIFIDNPYLPEDIEIGHPIYLANGAIQLVVVDKKGSEIKAKVVQGGILYSRKSINVPETNLKVSSLTKKDFKDIDFALKEGVDYIALSFVKDANDILRLRHYIDNPKIKIISKIERKQAILNLDEIIDASDIVMIARGDLGSELPIEELPLIQKDIIARANRKGKPSIVATQIMTNMINHPFPTRAEVSDIANAVLDGASALMLSDETALGDYPLKALSFLTRTIKRTEEFKFFPKGAII